MIGYYYLLVRVRSTRTSRGILFRSDKPFFLDRISYNYTTKHPDTDTPTPHGSLHRECSLDYYLCCCCCCCYLQNKYKTITTRPDWPTVTAASSSTSTKPKLLDPTGDKRGVHTYSVEERLCRKSLFFEPFFSDCVIIGLI